MQFGSSVFNLSQLCNVSKLDGLSWDPEGVHGSVLHVIAWDKQCFAQAV
jgi:hypothetical protein